MKRPSISNRLFLGTGLLVTVVLFFSDIVVYRTTSKGLLDEVRHQLLENSSLLAKSTEMESTGVVYEWADALESEHSTPVSGLFQLWDVNSGRTKRSPDLGDSSLVRFHGKLDVPEFRKIALPDGSPALAVGLLHLPFLDHESRKEMESLERVLEPIRFPQVLVMAREMSSVKKQLARLRGNLLRTGLATLVTIWLSIYFITRLTLRPILGFTERLHNRSLEDRGAIPEIPSNLPTELTGLATAFNNTLEKVEMARSRESEFALHAAHELRTPIAGLHAILQQSLHRPREPEDMKRRVTQAIEITSGMRTVIDGLMKLARLRGTIEAPVSENFDAAEMTRLIAQRCAARHPDREWRMMTADPSAHLTSDPVLVELLFGNLLENAFTHSTSGTIRIEIDSGSKNFHLRITNDRGNLDPTDAAKLFEPFQRGASSRIPEEGHAGLGLALCRDIARLLGGQLEMRFEDDSTITLSFVLPAQLLNN